MLFAALATMGWLAICGATHSNPDSSLMEFLNQ